MEDKSKIMSEKLCLLCLLQRQLPIYLDFLFCVLSHKYSDETTCSCFLFLAIIVENSLGWLFKIHLRPFFCFAEHSRYLIHLTKKWQMQLKFSILFLKTSLKWDTSEELTWVLWPAPAPASWRWDLVLWFFSQQSSSRLLSSQSDVNVAVVFANWFLIRRVGTPS